MHWTDAIMELRDEDADAVRAAIALSRREGAEQMRESCAAFLRSAGDLQDAMGLTKQGGVLRIAADALLQHPLPGDPEPSGKGET